jgi:hypothetical protein
MLCDDLRIGSAGGVGVRPYDDAAPSKRSPICVRARLRTAGAGSGHESRRKLRGCVRSFFPLANEDGRCGPRLNIVLIVDRAFVRPRLPSPFVQSAVRMSAKCARAKLLAGRRVEPQDMAEQATIAVAVRIRGARRAEFGMSRQRRGIAGHGQNGRSCLRFLLRP